MSYNNGKKIITKEFIEAINQYLREKKISRWKLASLVDLHPSELSRALNNNPIWIPVSKKMEEIAKKINFTGTCLKPQERPCNQIALPSVHGRRK